MDGTDWQTVRSNSPNVCGQGPEGGPQLESGSRTVEEAERLWGFQQGEGKQIDRPVQRRDSESGRSSEKHEKISDHRPLQQLRSEEGIEAERANRPALQKQSRHED